MSTYIYSKQDFIKWLGEQLSEDDCIVFTKELAGNLSHSKKTGIKVTHQYAHDVFTDEGVGHIAFGKTHPIGMLVADKNRLSESALKALNNEKS